MKSPKRKVAFVVQRCGEEVNGGSEQLCRTLAKQMLARWDVTIVTTCAIDYVSWADHYPSGECRIDGVRALRFSVDAPRDMQKFDVLCQALLAVMPNTTEQAEDAWMRAQGPYSSTLFQHLQEESYDAVIFFTYLFATTYCGLPLVADRAVLLPTAHDEWCIHLHLWDRVFEQAQCLVFLTPEEETFFRRRFPGISPKSDIIGSGLTAPTTASTRRFREKFDISEHFVVYAGRIDAGKGVHTLVSWFLANQERFGVSLVLLGKSNITLPEHPNLHALGFVDERSKWDALAAADALIMPSPHESLSLACLEAWAMKKPVLVNGACAALVGQCRRAQGGLWYESEAEFVAMLQLLLEDQQTAARLGAQGYAFVRQNCDWGKVSQRFARVVEDVWL